MKLYTIGACPNCYSNTWKRDQIDWRLKRYECFYCGQDVFLNRPRPDQSREMYVEALDAA